MAVNLLVVAAAMLLCLVSVSRIKEESYEFYYNKARLLLAEEMENLNQGKGISSKYNFILIDLSGVVEKSQGLAEYPKGELVNLTEILQTDASYFAEQKKTVKVVFPVYEEERADGFAVFYIDWGFLQKETALFYHARKYGPAWIGMLLFICLLFGRTIWLKKRVLNIIKEITVSSQAIIAGDYEKSPVSTGTRKLLSSEIDALTFSFEQMRDELKAREEREENLKRLQKEVVSCISHDLMTPISTIRAYGEGLRDGMAKEEEKRRLYVDTILAKTEVVTKMMKDLLEYSNTELNQLSIEKRESYFSRFFEGLLAEIGLYVEQKGIGFQGANHIPDVIVSMDEARILQTVYNLVENSMKYIGEGEGCIMIEGSYDGESKQVMISVKDNGIGIGMEDIPYVFNKFYRAEKARSTRVPGSGLGLSICKYIIDRHDGQITCSSKRMEGTNFMIRLPIM